MKQELLENDGTSFQQLPNATLEEADIVILPIGFQDTVSGQSGTKDAPKAIIAETEQLEFYEEDLDWCPMKHMKVTVLDEISEYDAITPCVEKLSLEDKLLISLGGEHSITPKITDKLLAPNTTIVFLDAHADLREQYMGNPNSHATPVHHLLAQGHKVVMAGIRSIYEKEAERIKSDENISCYKDRSLQNLAVKEEFFQELRDLQGDVYFSVDMDAFNPAYVPGVGTPQPGGLDWYFAMDVLETLFFNENVRIKGVDIVELIPEPSHVSQTFAAKLMHKIISYWGKSKGFDTKPMNGSQTLVEYD